MSPGTKRWLIGGAIASALLPVAPHALDAGLSRVSQRYVIARVIVMNRYQPGQYVLPERRVRDPWGQPLLLDPAVPSVLGATQFWGSAGPDQRAGTRDDVVPRTRHLVLVDWVENRAVIALAALLTLALWWRFDRLVRLPRHADTKVELARALRLAAAPCALTGLLAGALLGFGPAWNLIVGPVFASLRASMPSALPLELSIALGWFALGYALALVWRLRRPAA